MNRNGHQKNRRSAGQNGTPSKWQEFRAARHPEQEHEARKPRNDVPEFLPGQRMFGTVEKMMNSYGFIDVLDSRGRIFFHFSQVANGSNNEQLRVADEVEFEMIMDERNGRIVASKEKSRKFAKLSLNVSRNLSLSVFIQKFGTLARSCGFREERSNTRLFLRIEFAATSQLLQLALILAR